jgi:hypothetical protein
VLKRSSFGNCSELIQVVIERESTLDRIGDSAFVSCTPNGAEMRRPDVVFENQTASRQVERAVATRWHNLSSWRMAARGSIAKDDEFLEGYNHCFPA